MNNNKQSSVEWLINKIYMSDFELYNFMNEQGDFEQAKAMHKEEIENAYRIGYVKYLPYIDAEKYYKKTYGGNNGHI